MSDKKEPRLQEMDFLKCDHIGMQEMLLAYFGMLLVCFSLLYFEFVLFIHLWFKKQYFF